MSGNPRFLITEVGGVELAFPTEYVPDTLDSKYSDITSQTATVAINTAKGMSFPLYGSVNPYVSSTTATFVVIASFRYPGSAVYKALTKVNAVLSTSNAAGTAEIRIYNVTAALQVASVTRTGVVTQGISSTTTITNVPTTEAIFEIQVRQNGLGTGKFYAVDLEFV